MWLFIGFTQLLCLMSYILLGWFFRPQERRSKFVLGLSIVIVNNAFLICGLSDFWGERFNVYLVVSILQGFMLYAMLITVVIALVFYSVSRWLALPKFLQFSPIKARLIKKEPLQNQPLQNKSLLTHILKAKIAPSKHIRLLALIIYGGIVSLAVFNAYSPQMHHLTVITHKPMDKPMRIALVSDTHWSRWFGNRQIDKLTSLVDAQNPDVIVIAGDIMHDTTIAYDKTNMHERLSKLTAPLGVYATLGNHDYRGYDAQIARAVKDAGIKALDSQSVLLGDAVWLIGRSDDVDRTRLSAKALLDQVDTDKPVLFLEHRPTAFEELKGLPVDLHLSGHTHGGQIFPLTVILSWFEPLIHGSTRVGDTQFLVTSGYGIGAVPFRLGTRSEIWMVTISGSSIGTSNR